MSHPEHARPITLYFGDVVQLGTTDKAGINWHKTGVVGNVDKQSLNLAEIVGERMPVLTTFGTTSAYARLLDVPRWTTLDVATAIVRGHHEPPQTLEEIDLVVNTIKDLLGSFNVRAQQGPWTYPYGYQL